MKIFGKANRIEFERLPLSEGNLEKIIVNITVDKVQDFKKDITGKKIQIILVPFKKENMKIEALNRGIYNKKILKKESAKYKGKKYYTEHPSKNNINFGRPYPIE
jgi:hypothetical protein